MGVSIMGTYTDEAPPDTTIGTLIRLLSWKMNKDGLNPMDSSYHPRGTLTTYLPVICGHKDGCATDCPGDSLESLFPSIRNVVWEIIQNCPPASVYEHESEDIFVIYPQPAFEQLYIWLLNPSKHGAVAQIHDFKGKLLLRETIIYSGSAIDVSSLKAGVYIFSLTNGDEVYHQLVIIQ